MNTKQKHILSTQENADDNPKQNSTFTEREKIKGTPFTLIKLNEEYFMAMGDYRVTETTKTKEEQIDKLDTEKWLLIMHICIVAIQKLQTELYNHEKEYHKKQYEEKREEQDQYETESL